MRRRRATPYADTAALQANTATNPRKTLVAMESRIDLHSSAHAKGSARPPVRDRLRRHRFAGPRRRARRRPALGELTGQEVELPGADLAAVRGPAGMMTLG